MFIAAQRQLAILLPALLAATLAFACTSADEPARTPGFHAEVAVEVEPSPDDPLARFGVAEGRSVIRWWYVPDPVRWRWEIETVGSIIDDGVALTVVNETDSWEYDDRSNTYRRASIAAIPDGVILPPTFSAPVGPANAETIDALIDQWRERGGQLEVGLAGEATLLGRRTQIVEIRPPGGGIVRAFVDPERMFIMRWAVDGEGGGQSYSSEVTALDYDTEIDAGRFTFDPPPGAREVEAPYVQSCSRSSGPLGGASFPAKPGFLRPAYAPAGYQSTAAGVALLEAPYVQSCSRSSGPLGGASFPAKPGFLRPAYAPAGYHSTAAGSEGSANGGCGPVAVWALLEGPDGGYILLRQRLRPGGVPRAARSWQPVDSGLEEAYRYSEGGVLSLLWRDGDVVALLESASVSFGELLRIAESSSLVPPAP